MLRFPIKVAILLNYFDDLYSHILILFMYSEYIAYAEYAEYVEYFEYFEFLEYFEYFEYIAYFENVENVKNFYLYGYGGFPLGRA